MPIPFHDADEVAQLGLAAFLHLPPPVADDSCRYGALFLINARGEPQEFGYNRVELQQPALWRALDREQAAVRRLTRTLFEAVTLTPSLLLCRADRVGPHIFGADDGLALTIPVVRLAPAGALIGYLGNEAQQTIDTIDQHGECQDIHLFWTPQPPEGMVAVLFQRLLERGLTLEPFARAHEGLCEVFPELRTDEP